MIGQGGCGEQAAADARPAGAIDAAHRFARGIVTPRGAVLADCTATRPASLVRNQSSSDWRRQVATADQNLRQLFEEVGAACAHARTQIDRLGEDLAQSGLLAMLEIRLPDTYAHAQRVARASVALARAMRLTGPEVRIVRRAALLHDIGKLAVPAHLLRRRGRLSEQEIAVLQHHVTIGAELLQGIPTLADLAPLVAATHERYDGSGYPYKLAGSTIPVVARIIAVADCYDAMITRRPYCEPVSRQDARDELARCAGSHFDPAIVAEWLGIFDPPAFSLRSETSQAIPVRKH